MHWLPRAQVQVKWRTSVFAVCALGELQAASQRKGMMPAEEELVNAEHVLC
jgi:hypothetical protein